MTGIERYANRKVRGEGCLRVQSRAKMLRAEIAAQQAAMDEAARSVKVLMGTEDCARERLEAYAALRAEVAA